MATTRTRTTQVKVPETWRTQFDVLNNVWLSGTSSVGWTDRIDDNVSPGIFRKMRRGELLPVNDLVVSKRELAYLGAADCFWQTPGSARPSSRFHGNAVAMRAKNTPLIVWGATASPTPPALAPYLQRALAQARTQGWDVGTFVAEFSKTSQMIRKAGRTFNERAQRIYHQVRSKSPRRNRRLLEEFSEAWLEYRYGWRTLAFDLQDANEAIQSFNTVSSRLTRATVRDEFTVTKNSSTWSTGLVSDSRSGGVAQFSHLYQDEGKTIVRAGVGLVGALKDSPLIVNPLVTAYELVPYSFIVDWFFNLGEAVNAWAPFLRGSVAYGFTSVERVTTRVATLTPVSTGGGSVAGGNLTPSVSIGTVTTRSRLRATPTLDLRFRINLDTAKVADIVAMVLLGNARRLKDLARRR